MQRRIVQPRQSLHGQGAILGQRLRGRWDHAPLYAVQRALTGRVKDAQAVHLVAKELDAHRVQGIRGKDVQDAPTAAERARFLDDAGHVIAQLHPGSQHLGQREPLSNAQRAHAGHILAPGNGRLHQRARRGDHQRWLRAIRGLAARVCAARVCAACIDQGRKHAKPLAHSVHRPGNALIGQRFRLGKAQHAARLAAPVAIRLRQPRLELIDDDHDLFRACHHQEHRTPQVLRQGSNQVGPGGPQKGEAPFHGRGFPARLATVDLYEQFLIGRDIPDQ